MMIWFFPHIKEWDIKNPDTKENTNHDTKEGLGK